MTALVPPAVTSVATIAALGIALVHVFGSRLLDTLDSPHWVLSTAGGAAVAYVFVEALPALRVVGERLAAEGHPLVTVTGDVFLLTMVGFVVYYGLDHLVEVYVGDGDGNGGGDRDRSDDGDGTGSESGEWHGTPGFAVHLAGFLVYDVLIGYLLVYPNVLAHHRGAFAVAMGLHLLGTDYDLREHDEALFHDVGRWLLAAGVILGTALGHLVSFGLLGPAIAYAFLVGGIVLNVMKTELPAARESRLPAFLAGVVGYTAVLLLFG